MVKNFKFNVVADISNNSVAISKEVRESDVSDNSMHPTIDSLAVDIEIHNEGEYVWGIKSPATSLWNNDNALGESEEIRKWLPMLTGACVGTWIEPNEFERSRIEEAMKDADARGVFGWQVVRRGIVDYCDDYRETLAQ